MSNITERPLRNWRLAVFAAPAFLSQLVHAPASTVVPTIYSTEFGLSLTLVGTALLISRSADVVIDPLIGYLSDKTGGRLGARKPWIILGGLLTMVSAWFLFSPPLHPSFAYFLFWYTAIYVCWSLIEIPHAAWGYELTRDYSQRSRVLSFRVFAQAIAALAFLALPTLPIFRTTAVTPETLRFIGWMVLVLVPLTLVAVVVWAPTGIPVEREAHYKLKDLLSILRGNRPLWIFLSGFVLWGFAGGMFGALTFLYFANYLGLAKQFVFLFGGLAIAALAFIPMAPWVINRLGKRVTWAGSMAVGLLIFPLMLLVPKGEAGVLPLAILLLPIGFTNAMTLIAAQSLMGDVIDYDTWRTGQKRTAIYAGLLSFVTKLNAIPGGAVALMIVGLMGYQPKLAGANSAHAILGLKIAFVIAPGILFGLAILLACVFPIDRRRQGIISRRLASREARDLRAAEAAAAAGVQVVPGLA
jgi:GPH family glycoside/pentoside/hexuronide:cation symporter